ncbi:hypothetical protein RBWH47_05766 [Rhodopirellula baltica WH47]|uniref:Uncharacterized protein n=1 Tax=Rhodopirellula baltica WH47 TaxID=991778 RepID=F2ASR3_RHOBT|nr:hypothetical protein RBWH47_05766 [Rhodopirellula baltica WH47]
MTIEPRLHAENPKLTSRLIESKPEASARDRVHFPRIANRQIQFLGQ